MADQEKTSTLVRTTNEMKSDIVCPLCLKIAIASMEQSDGTLGAIQSYRCAPRPNSGGWETRPQAKSDKWTADFYTVLHAPRGEDVILSDGVTMMKGLGKDEDTKSIHFSHADGQKAKAVAIKYVKQGKLKAPKSWDRSFAAEAGMSKEELERTYPELYNSTSTRKTKEDEVVEPLGDEFYDDVSLDEEGSAHVEAEDLDTEDEAQIEAEEEAFEEEPSYSVVAELELDEPTADEEEAEETGHFDSPRTIRVKKPSSTNMMTLHAPVKAIKADMGGKYVMFYKVKDPNTNETVWLHEGWNKCFGNLKLEVTER